MYSCSSHDLTGYLCDFPADHAALSFELWRLVQENDMLRARTAEMEADVQHMVDTSETLGHGNPKQKLQYHMR